MSRAGVERLRTWCVERRVELGLLVGFGLLYGLTMFPGPGGRLSYGDSARFQHLPLHDGVPPGTGYPTYLVLSDLFETLWPAARAATRVTALSVVAGAFAVALFGALARRLSGDRRAAALAATLFGVSTTVWTVATEAGVYSLHLLFVVGTLLALVAWRDHRRPRDLLIACLLHALSYGNHLTTVLLLPTVAFMSLEADWRAVLQPKRVALILWCVALGAAQYLMVFSHGDVLAHATGAQLEDRFLAGSASEALFDGMGALLSQGATELSAVGLVLGVLGAASWRRMDRTLAVGLGLFAACSLTFGLVYTVERGLFFEGLWLVTALVVATALARIERSAWMTAVGLGAIGLAAWHAVERGEVLVGDNPRDEEQAAWIAEAEGCEALLAGPEDDAHTQLRAYLSVTHDHGPMPLPRDPGRALELERFCFTPEHLRAIAGSSTHRVEPYLEQSLRSFLGEHRDEVVVLAVRGEASRHLSAQTRAQVGGELSALGEGESYAAVLRGGAVLAEARSEHERVRIDLDPDREGWQPPVSISVVSAGARLGDLARIEIAGEEVMATGRGMNLAVLDEAGAVVATATFDTYVSERRVRLYRAVPREDAETRAGLYVLEAWGTEGEASWLVDGVVPSGAAWDAEGCLRFVGEGSGVLLRVRGAPIALSIAADNNDAYEVWCDRGAGLEHVADVPPVEGWGIVARRVEVPDLPSCTRIGLRPGAGDGASSIAEVTALAAPSLEVLEAVGTLGEPAVVVDGVAPESGAPWDCEGCLRFVEDDATVVLEVHAVGTALLVTADNNDVYTVSCDRGEGFERLAEVPAVAGWGMVSRRVETPALTGCARLQLSPLRGDGWSSIAEVELLP